MLWVVLLVDPALKVHYASGANVLPAACYKSLIMSVLCQVLLCAHPCSFNLPIIRVCFALICDYSLCPQPPTGAAAAYQVGK